MSPRLSWKQDDGDHGSEWFDNELDAIEAAERVDGTAIVADLATGTILHFAHGRQLSEEEVAQKMGQFDPSED